MKMLRKALALLTILIIASSASPSVAGLIGATVSADYYFPDAATVLYPSGEAVVGDGVEFDNIGGFMTVDVSDTNVLITYPIGITFSGAPKTLDGFIISDVLGTAPSITGVSLAGTNIPGFDGSQLAFDADHVFMNQLGFTSFDPGSFISVDLQFESTAAVPEPSSLALCGLGVFAAAVRKRRRKVVV